MNDDCLFYKITTETKYINNEYNNDEMKKTWFVINNPNFICPTFEKINTINTRLFCDDFDTIAFTFVFNDNACYDSLSWAWMNMINGFPKYCKITDHLNSFRLTLATSKITEPISTKEIATYFKSILVPDNSKIIINLHLDDDIYSLIGKLILLRYKNKYVPNAIFHNNLPIKLDYYIYHEQSNISNDDYLYNHYKFLNSGYFTYSFDDGYDGSKFGDDVYNKILKVLNKELIINYRTQWQE